MYDPSKPDGQGFNGAGVNNAEELRNKLKILLIDDEADFCYFVKLNLEKTGRFEVLTATNGQDGIVLASRELPDLIILDVVMPGLGGGEVAARLQESHKTGHIPILFITAIASRTQVQAHEGLIGGRKFIAKPVTPDELMAKIDGLGIKPRSLV